MGSRFGQSQHHFPFLLYSYSIHVHGLINVPTTLVVFAIGRRLICNLASTEENTMDEKLLTSVRLVCESDPRVGTLLHVARQIDSFRFSYDKWTLEDVSKRGFVNTLDHIHLLEPKRDVWFHIARFRAAVFTAIKNGYDIRVLEWWLNKYSPESREIIMTDILVYAVSMHQLDVLKWIRQYNQGRLPYHNHCLSCSDPETAHWLFEHGRHLLLEFPMYACSVADPTLEFAKWCLTQPYFRCMNAEDAVSFAIDYDQEQYLQWLFEHRLDLFQPDHLDRAISHGRLQIMKWLLEKFPRQFFSDPSTMLATSVFESSDNHVLELIRWVAFELEWQTKNARDTWMDGLLVSVAGSGKINLLQAVQSELYTRSHNNNAYPSLIEAVAANGHLSMLQ